MKTIQKALPLMLLAAALVSPMSVWAEKPARYSPPVIPLEQHRSHGSSKGDEPSRVTQAERDLEKAKETYGRVAKRHGIKSQEAQQFASRISDAQERVGKAEMARAQDLRTELRSMESDPVKLSANKRAKFLLQETLATDKVEIQGESSTIKKDRERVAKTESDLAFTRAFYGASSMEAEAFQNSLYEAQAILHKDLNENK